MSERWCIGITGSFENDLVGALTKAFKCGPIHTSIRYIQFEVTLSKEDVINIVNDNAKLYGADVHVGINKLD